MIKYGIISQVEKGRAKVNFEEDGFVSDLLPVLVRKSKTDKENWQLEVDEHVVCIMDDRCDEGVILGAIVNNIDVPDEEEGAGKYRKRFADGTFIEYNRNTGVLTVDVQGDIIANATGSITAEAQGEIMGKSSVKATIQAPDVTLQGNVNVSGTLTVSGALSAASIATSGGGAITATGDITVSGSITATGAIQSGAISLSEHKHLAPSGGGTTGPALP